MSQRTLLEKEAEKWMEEYWLTSGPVRDDVDLLADFARLKLGEIEQMLRERAAQSKPLGTSSAAWPLRAKYNLLIELADEIEQRYGLK
jgi:hypothetical protein